MSQHDQFTTSQVESAIKDFLKFGEDQNGIGHKGYFSGSGWAAHCLRSHLAALSATQPAQAAPSGCTRSHPHEDMSPMCELRTQIARLTNENVRLQAQAAQSTNGERNEDQEAAKSNSSGDAQVDQLCVRHAAGRVGEASPSLTAQAAQSEPASALIEIVEKHCAWLNKLPIPTTGCTHQMMQLQKVIDALAQRAAQGAGEVVSDASKLIHHPFTPRKEEFEALYLSLCERPLTAHEIARRCWKVAATAQPAPVVPDGWWIREDDTWIYFKRPDGFCQAVTPNDPHTSHAKTLHMLMRAMLTATPTPTAQAAQQGEKA